MSKQEFTTDVARLLQIVAGALYSDRDVFLRELISNAADACDRLRYEAQVNKAVKAPAKFEIKISHDSDAGTLTIADNGIGMNKQDLIDHLGTIARSGTKAIMDQLAASKDEQSLSLIGQFGVGFYASFMVADEVTVLSRKAGEDETWEWTSDGATGYDIKKSKTALDNAGTQITLNLKDDARDYLLDPKLTEIIKTWSDHIAFPILLGDETDPVNEASALWTKPKSQISEDQYKGFFNTVGGGMGMDEPLATMHWSAEGVIAYTGLIYIPSLRPWDLFDPSRKNSLKLYVRRVFITDKAEGLLYPWLRFLRGVVDSEDLPLNISREMLQHNPVLSKIRSGVTKKVLSELKKLADKDREKYTTFWQQFGPVLKEGLYDAPEYRDDLLALCRFNSTRSEDSLTRLEDYIARMKPDQDKIYYLAGENMETLKNSPQLEGFKARGVEVLYMTDTIDDFWLQASAEFDGKEFVSITKGSVDLNEFAAEDKKDAPKKDKKTEATLEKLCASLTTILVNDVAKVRVSSRLVDSPVCLVADDNAADINMERVLKIHQNYQPEAKRVLEINPDHSIIKAMADKDDVDAIRDMAFLLLDQARVALGEPVPNPMEFSRRLNQLMQKSLVA